MVRFKERFKMLRPVLVPFVFYIGALAFSASWLEDNPDSSFRSFLSLVPIFPAIWIAFSLVNFLKKLDELEQRIINEAASFSFMFTFLLLLTMSFLGQAGIEMPDPVFIVMFMVVFLLIGKIRGNRRYE